MKIQLFTHYYPPEVNAPASRAHDHARMWRDLGHDVTIVTCAPNHPGGKLFPGFRNRLFQRSNEDGIEVIRLWTLLAANEGFLLRISNYLSYLLSVMIWGWRLPKADVVISTSPQFFCGLAGWLFKRRRVPWILEIRDIWPASIVSVGAMKRGLVIRLLERIEAAAYRAADVVVPVTDSFVNHIRISRPDAPVSVIKNGLNLKQFVRVSETAGEAFRSEHGLSGKFIASYVGTHGMAHGLDCVIDAAKRLRDRSDIAFLLVGDGSERARLEAECKAEGLTNVLMLGQQPKALMPTIWSVTDAALVLLRKLDLFKDVLPSKMFEAMGLACPIILGVEGEALALVEEAQAGIGIEPESGAELAAAVLRLADDAALCARLGASGKSFVEANFDRERLARRYLDTMQAAIAAKRK